MRAIIDRFLEHARIFHFANGGKDEVYISSADWMPRNFHRRVEVMVPIEDAAVRARLIEILAIQWSDNVKAWVLEPHGAYVRVRAEAGRTAHPEPAEVHRAHARQGEGRRSGGASARAGST